MMLHLAEMDKESSSNDESYLAMQYSESRKVDPM